MADELGRFLDIASRRTATLANNMANVDTPGFHTRDIDFRSALRDAGGSSAGRAREVSGLVARPDGNNVSVDRESMALAETQLQFRTGTALLKREFQRVSDAIRDDK